MTPDLRTSARVISATSTSQTIAIERSSVSWKAIFAGTFAALLTYLIFMSLGVAIGSSALEDIIRGQDGAAGLGWESLIAYVTGVVEKALYRFSERITRVEVHLNDENSHKNGQDDKRCMMEARLEGRQPTAVTDQAASMHQAINGAAEKLCRAIESTLGRMRDAS